MPSRCAVVMTSVHWSTVMRPGAMLVAHRLVEYLRGRAGEGADARVAESAQVVLDGPARADRAVEHFLRREAVDVDIRQVGFQLAGQVDVEGAFHLGGQPGLDADLGRAEVRCLPCAADDLVEREEVALLLAEVAAERAEAAPFDADVGEVDVAVDDVGDAVAVDLPAQFVRRGHQREEPRAVGLEEARALLHGDLAAFEGFREDAGDVSWDAAQQRLQPSPAVLRLSVRCA